MFEELTNSDNLIETVDVIRHSDIIMKNLEQHRSLVLCGPPGSGKSMTLIATLKNLS